VAKSSASHANHRRRHSSWVTRSVAAAEAPLPATLSAVPSAVLLQLAVQISVAQLL
jgi:hypothetical protein